MQNGPADSSDRETRLTRRNHAALGRHRPPRRLLRAVVIAALALATLLRTRTGYAGAAPLHPAHARLPRLRRTRRTRLRKRTDQTRRDRRGARDRNVSRCRLLRASPCGLLGGDLGRSRTLASARPARTYRPYCSQRLPNARSVPSFG